VVGDTTNDDDRAEELWGFDTNNHLVVHSAPHRTADTEPRLFDRMHFDGLGRLTHHQSGGGSDTFVQYDGLESIVTDPFGHETHILRDATGRVVQMQDAKGGVTTYEFGPFGKLVELLDPVGQSHSGHLRSWQYDDYGTLKQSTDPDRGSSQYTYSAFGLLTNLTLADLGEKKYTYDLLSRPLTADTRDGHTAWTWDQGTGGIGQLTSVAGPDANVTKSYLYDQFARIKTATTQSGSLCATFTYRYDPSGRVSSLLYPSGAGTFEAKFDYDKGNVVKTTDISDPQHTNVLWTWNQADSSNRVISDALGSAVARTRHFDDRHHGALDSVLSKHGSQVIQNLTYGYDNKDNLIARADAGGWNDKGATAASHAETFCYDELDRITDGSLDQTVSCGHGNPYHYAYDADGNITSKSGEGTLVYDSTHPHALRSDGTQTYGYDVMGNQITRPRFPDPSGAPGLIGTPRIQYSSLDLPKAYFGGNVSAGSVNACNPSSSGAANCYCGNVTDGAGTTTNWCSDFPITFQYDGDGTRIRKDSPDLSSFYADGLYERATDRHDSTATHRYYIPTPAGVVGLVSRKTSASGQVVAGSSATQYTLTDHAGSADVVVDGSGATIERHSYDPFGRRRSANWTPDALTGKQSSDPNLTGYTGHQDDFELGLVNMKGRMYDPKIGRFLTPDPRIGGGALQSQDLNHYSYVGNNPLSFPDPTGFERVNVNYAPTDGSDMEVTVFVNSDPSDNSVTYNFPSGGYSPDIAGERVWGPVNNFGWGNVSRVNVQPLVDQIDKSNKEALIKAGHAYVTGAILYCLPLRVVVVLAGIGLLDPSPASAPPSDGTFEPAPRHSALRVAVGIGVPVVLGAIAAGRGGGGADPEQIASIENQLGQRGSSPEPAYPEGSFSISDWSDYPGNVRPTGPFRILEGAEYDQARDAASAANDAMRRINRPAYQGNQIHEIQPVKFGGSPTDMANKLVTPTPLHYQYTSWWNQLQRDLGF
jgi:RHS repeat-associated protein